MNLDADAETIAEQEFQADLEMLAKLRAWKSKARRFSIVISRFWGRVIILAYVVYVGIFLGMAGATFIKGYYLVAFWLVLGALFIAGIGACAYFWFKRFKNCVMEKELQEVLKELR